MRKINLLTLISLFIFFSCQSEKNTETVNDDFPETIEVPMNPSPGDNSMNALDWEGTYVGTLPCADCEGIETELTINYDGTYSYKTNYLGKELEAEEVTGTFQWDENGSVITLVGLDGAPGKYKVGENRIWHLDMEGKQIEGDLADKYILTKQ
ncbi:copper resistance protein NlpE [Algoriphagus formosus]|uniref:Copper resistance protein NlpE n=1 Tax=Algoriphagus formosus TaxID=2007308 RepID=A0A4R5V275_9BACT|nr:copper resistance protein NlpE [Algoriphagus aquimaris]TDK45536.1 copper resistance protein NlpE [Algoriphagus aquimaris]